jgi:hypothetical protein
MELKINRLATTFAVLFFCVAAFHFFVEIANPRVHLYHVLNHIEEDSIMQEFDIHDFNQNSIFVSCLDSVEKDMRIVQVEVPDDVYFRIKEGDSLYIYFTPYKKDARAILDQRNPDFYTLKEPKKMQYSTHFGYFILPTVVMILSLLVIFLPYFEIKLALFLFDIIILTVLQWFNP